MSTIFTEEGTMETDEMRLYVWKLEGHDCKCRYSVMAKSLEKAREIMLYDLTKREEKECILCVIPMRVDYKDMTFAEKKGRLEQVFHGGVYLVRNWIRDTEPGIHEAGRMFRD